MNLEKKTGINIGDFATGILFYHHLHKETQKDIEPEEFAQERHSGPVIELKEGTSDIQAVIEVIKRTHIGEERFKYRYRFSHIYEVECICGNKKLFRSEKEKWYCPWCNDD